MSTDSLNGKVVVITGASSGFGKGVAQKIAAEGVSLVLAARRENLLLELAQECEAAGSRAVVLKTDVSKEENIGRLTQKALSEFGRIDIWINNAGVGALGRFENIPLEDHAQVIRTNLLGTTFGSYYALRQFRQQSSGGILINLASAVGKISTPYYASYVASKFGIVGLCDSLRQELKENHVDNIHICTVMPMAMDTPFFDHTANYTGHEAVPIPPLYDPQKVIDVIVRLTLHPEDEIIVGAAGIASNAAHHIIPGMIERFMSRQTQKAQIEKAPAAAQTSGSVHTPMAEGTEVTGHRLKKFAA